MREEDRGALQRFLFPHMSKGYFLRLSIVVFVAYGFFGHICRPMRIQGVSMAPTYSDHSFTFCWRQTYQFREPKRFDVVTVRLAGPSVMFLKRVVAFEGETVAFRSGKLLIDGKELDEPYIRYDCDWNKPPTEVKKGHIYVVGDNRSVPIDAHRFGQVERSRITGSPVW